MKEIFRKSLSRGASLLMFLTLLSPALEAKAQYSQSGYGGYPGGFYQRRVTAFVGNNNYQPGRPVVFGIRNDGPRPVFVNASWSIYRQSTYSYRRVFSGPTQTGLFDRDSLVNLRPGESRQWSWNQNDFAGQPVGPGRYLVYFNYLGVYARFNIIETPGQGQLSLNILSVNPAQGVTFALTNNSLVRVDLPNSAPWRIVRVNPHTGQRQVVFTPVATQMITPVESGQRRTWSWDFRDNTGRRVGAGIYEVEFVNFNLRAFFRVPWLGY